MNPITSQNNFMNVFNAIRSGQMDAKSEVLSRLNNMNAEQKAQLKNIIPLLKQYAGKLGISAEVVDKEIGAHL